MSLYSQLCNPSLLYKAWESLNKNMESHGVNEENTIRNFKQNLHTKIPSIEKQLKNNTYRFSPTRAAVIKKSNGKKRPLLIPEIDDRIVLKSIGILLASTLENSLKTSKGYSFATQRTKGYLKLLML